MFHCKTVKRLALYSIRIIFAKPVMPPLDFKKNFMTSFYGWGSTASRLEPLRGGSLPFTTKFPKIPGTHFIDLETMNG